VECDNGDGSMTVAFDVEVAETELGCVVGVVGGEHAGKAGEVVDGQFTKRGCTHVDFEDGSQGMFRGKGAFAAGKQSVPAAWLRIYTAEEVAYEHALDTNSHQHALTRTSTL